MLSWPCWLTHSGRLNRKVVTHPASSLAQDTESSPAETSVLTTMLRRQPVFQKNCANFIFAIFLVSIDRFWQFFSLLQPEIICGEGITI